MNIAQVVMSTTVLLVAYLVYAGVETASELRSLRKAVK